MRKARRNVSHRTWWLVVLASSLASVGACVASDFADGQFACDPSGAAACPPGLLCASDGLCRTRELADGQALDGRVDMDGTAVGEGGVDAPIDANEAADACTTATWSFANDARSPNAVALDDEGHLYAAGQSQNEAWVAELDTCDGGVVREHTFQVPGTTGPSLSDVVATKTTLLVAGGGASPNAVAGTIDKALSTSTLSIVPGANISGLFRIAVATDGAMWAAGQKNIFATPSQGWVVRVTPPKCEATVGVGVAVAQGPGGSMYVMIDSGTTSQINMMDSACAVGATVGPALSLGGVALSTASLFAQGGVLYASGTVQVTSSATGNRFVFLAALDLATNMWTVSKLDPNPVEPDIVGEAVTDTTSIFLGVTQRAGFGTGTATIYRFDPPYTATSVPVATSLPFGAKQIAMRSIAVSPAGQDAVYVAAGAIDGTAGIARCRKSGQCPP